MNKKILAYIIALVSIIGAQIVVITNSTTYKIMHYGNCGNTYYQVIAPVDVKIGESFSVDINFTVNEEMCAYTFYIWIHGAGTSWTNTIADNGEVVYPGNIVRTATVTPTEKGAVWVGIYLGFYDSGDDWHDANTNFGICMPRFKTYKELQSDYSELDSTHNDLEDDYESLNATYESLENNYDSLQTNYADFQESYDALESDYNSAKASMQTALNTTGILLYVFIAATIAFLATTIYFAVRKPKGKAT